jgi:hypothetical protein
VFEILERIIITAAMTATITATMMVTIRGLLIMCRSMPNLAPSGNKSMPHFGHFPEFGWRTSGCIGNDRVSRRFGLDSFDVTPSSETHRRLAQAREPREFSDGLTCFDQPGTGA